MANLTLNRGEKLIFNDNNSGTDGTSYLAESAANIFERHLSGTKIDEVRIFGASGSSNRAAVFKFNGHDGYAAPIDLTGAAIQTAIDNLSGGGIVQLPSGNYPTSATITLPSNICLQGSGMGATKITATGSGLTSALIQSKNTSLDYSRITIRDLTVDNQNYSTSGGIGIDFTRISNSFVQNVSATRVATGFKIKAASKNTFTNIYVSDASTGMDFAADTTAILGANDNRILNASLTDVGIGFDVEGAFNNFLSCSVKRGSTRSFTRGFRFKATYGVSNFVMAPLFDNGSSLPGTDYAIEITSSALDTVIISPALGSVTNFILDSSSPQRTVILGSYYRNYATDQTKARMCLGDIELYTQSGELYVRNPADNAYMPDSCYSLKITGGDLEFDTVNKGLVCTTPDGSKKYRIAIDNSGAFVPPVLVP